jgi:hypothetical protein
MKRGYRLRTGDQVPTRLVTVAEIMQQPEFARGAADVRAGRGYPTDYDAWGHDDCRWSYERGRQWATLAPRHIPLMINGKVTRAALGWYRSDIL